MTQAIHTGTDYDAETGIYHRDESRLMVIHRKTGEIEHRQFKNILEYFDENDLFIFNDTKVFPARLWGNKEKTGARIEVFLLRELNPDIRFWDVLVDPARKIRIGNKLYFGEDESLVAEVIDNTTSRGRTLRFLFDGSYEEFKSTLFSLGKTPVPTWVKPEPEPEVTPSEDESDANATVITAAQAAKLNATFYSLSGAKLSTPKKGVNIAKFADGTSKKLFVK